MDGIDQWLTLSLNLPAKARHSVLINIDERARNAATRAENWKLIVTGVTDDARDGYYGNYWDMFDGYGQVYNTSAVVGSKSGQAIKSVANSLFVPWADEKTIEMRRRQATVRCYRTWDTTSGLFANENETGDRLKTIGGGIVTNSSSCRGSPCLFNVDVDPCETTNLASQYPAIASHLYEILRFYRTTLVPQITQPPDAARANPKLWHRTWSPWVS